MSWREYKKGQTFSVPIGKEVTNIDKDGNKSVLTLYLTNLRKLNVKKIVIVFLNMKVLRII